MTVAHLENTMSQRELMEWREYADLEPFGPVVQDALNAHALSTHANLKRDPSVRPQPFVLNDFLLFREPEHVPAVEPRFQGLTDKEWQQKFAMEALAAQRNRSNTNNTS